MSRIKEFLLKIFDYLKESGSRGVKWIGFDGLLNMESFALLLILLIIFFQYHWAILITCFAAALKSYVDKKRGHKNEKHDLICAALGIIIGFIIVVAILL